MGRTVLFFLSLFPSVQRVFLAALLFGGIMLLPFSAHAQTEEFPISLQGVPESSVSPELFACVNVANDRYVRDVSIRYSDWLREATQCYRVYEQTSLLSEFLQTYDFSTAASDFALDNCNADVQRGQYERIATCLWTSGNTTEQCYAAEKNTTIQLLSICYREEIPEDSIWNLPIMQQSIEVVLGDADYHTLSMQTKYTLDACLQHVLDGSTSDTLDTTKQEALSGCYTEAHLPNIAAFFTKTKVVIDCTAEAAQRRGVSSITSLLVSRTDADESYIEQCVIKKTAPVILGIATFNIPFVAGFANILVYLQFLITQPLLLLRGSRSTWGRVLDAVSGEPIDLSSVRLIDEEKNRIMRSMVTNRKGEYFFLPPLGRYRVEADKHGYVFPSTLRKGDAQYYFGHVFTVDSKDDVIDKHIPLDPSVDAVSVHAFLLKKWRYRIASFFSLIGPLSSLIFFVLVPTWWVGLLGVMHIILFIVFRRLSGQTHVKQFGVVTGRDGKPLTRVKVLLFNGPYHKLLHYYVTDMFGRYYFPPVVGSFVVRFEKEGFVSQSKEFEISPTDDIKTLNIDVALDVIQTS